MSLAVRVRLAGALPVPLPAAACSSGDRATHSAASSGVAKVPRYTILPPRHTCAS